MKNRERRREGNEVDMGVEDRAAEGSGLRRRRQTDFDCRRPSPSGGKGVSLDFDLSRRNDLQGLYFSRKIKL